MHVHFRTAFAAAFVVCGVPQWEAAFKPPREILTAKELRKAESEARTAADHSRLAAYYEFKARKAQANLTEEEEQMKHWGAMADRTKIPNPYSSARALAGMYRAELKKMTKLAAHHRKIAESLQGRPT